jgi:uncharacterized protein (DUF983 family)
MLNSDQDAAREGAVPASESAPDAGPDIDPDTESDPPKSSPPLPDEGLIEELGAVIDDARLYAAAEIAFQRTRAKLLGRNVGVAAAAIALALILLHIALIAMAVGLVIALEPLVGIWGSIAIVVGVMLIGVGALVYLAADKGKIIAEMFSHNQAGNASHTASDTASQSASDGDAS